MKKVIKCRFTVGQEVIVKSRYNEYISVVEKITPTGLVRVKGEKKLFKGDTGSRKACEWYYASIHAATPSEVEKIRRKEYLTYLEVFEFSDLSDAQLKELKELITRFSK